VVDEGNAPSLRSSSPSRERRVTRACREGRIAERRRTRLECHSLLRADEQLLYSLSQARGRNILRDLSVRHSAGPTPWRTTATRKPVSHRLTLAETASHFSGSWPSRLQQVCPDKNKRIVPTRGGSSRIRGNDSTTRWCVSPRRAFCLEISPERATPLTHIFSQCASFGASICRDNRTSRRVVAHARVRYRDEKVSGYRPECSMRQSSMSIDRARFSGRATCNAHAHCFCGMRIIDRSRSSFEFASFHVPRRPSEMKREI